MGDRNRQDKPDGRRAADQTDFAVDEHSIEKHNQFQMLPTPDEQQQGEGIKRLDV